jgi:WS/DGAT/MGAT family acyltransferase
VPGERLPGLDAAFLALETETTLLHVTGVLVLDAAGVPAEAAYRRIRSRIAERLDSVPPFRRRLQSAPFGLDHPTLVETAVDLDYHVRRAGLPRPGGRAQLEALAADVASRPLDRRRPLWEMHVVDGLADGGVAVVAKIHHAIVDGVAGAELLAMFLDLEPNPRPAAVTPITPIDRGRRPLRGEDPAGNADEADGSGAWLDLEPWMQLLGSMPGRLDDTVRTLGRTLHRLATVAPERRRAPNAAPLPFSAPKTPLNRSVSSYRRVAFADLDMDDVRRVRRVLGGTVNDVVLSTVTGSLRGWLATRDQVPDRPLVAMVPVSVRAPAERGSLGNRLSALFVHLPVGLTDPAARLAAVRSSAAAAKELDADDRARLLGGWAEWLVPTVAARASRLATDRRLLDRVRPPFNLVVSNVPGPSEPLWLAGLRLEAMYPLGPVTEGAAVNVTVVSYIDRIHVGIQTCWDAVPDVEVLVRGVEDGLAELVRTADRRDRPVPWWHAEVLPA